MCVTGTASKSPVTGRVRTLALLRRGADTEAPEIKGGYAGHAMRTAAPWVIGKWIENCRYDLSRKENKHGTQYRY
jgi:hypothetical protein